MEIFGLVDIPVWVLILLTICLLFYYYTSINFNLFVKMGIKGPKPLPVFGNLLAFRKGLVEAETGWYQKYGRIFGIHEGHFPLLFIGDLDMLKDIMVKEFSSFTNRRNFGLRQYARPPHSLFLNIQEDDEWRHNRNTQTPTFSGGKLKKMSPLINKACASMVKAMKAKADLNEPLDAKTFAGAFAMEVIGSTAFGLDLDIQSTPEDPFVKYARKFFQFSLFDPIFLTILIMPFVLRIIGLLKLETMPPDALKFFSKIAHDALDERRRNPGKFNDFLESMLNAEREGQKADAESEGAKTTSASQEGSNLNEAGHWVDTRKGLTEDEILAACIMFFSAGFETTSTTLAQTLYHLAMNPDCQDKLIAEIDQHFPNGKSPAYEDLGNMQYLEMVIMETLRIAPPASRVDRVCSRDVNIRGLDIPAGTTVAIPIYLIHHDPEYWPDPHLFDPDRFTPENRKRHHPLQWLGFGTGPRNCIGMRLAQIEVKFALINLLQAYTFTTNNKTEPPAYGKLFFLVPINGIWITAKHRE